MLFRSYIDKEILERNPFQTLDVNGVGSLVKIAIANGKSVKPNIEVGVCGEHGGDPNSIKFFHNAGVSYVSASPHRIPISIVAAAQSRLLENSAPKKSKVSKKKTTKAKKASKKSKRRR